MYMTALMNYGIGSVKGGRAGETRVKQGAPPGQAVLADRARRPAPGGRGRPAAHRVLADA